MPITWAVLTDDQFPVNATPGSTVVGPATFVSPSTGAAYVDHVGSIWGITSGVLSGVNLSTTSTSSFSTDTLERPVGEAQINSQVVARISFNGTFPPAQTHASTPVLWLREQTSGQAYIGYCFPNSTTSGSLTIGRLSAYGGTNTTISSTSWTIPSTTDDYILTFYAFGSNPTILFISVADANSPGTIIAQLTSTDTTSALQSAGVAAVSANFPTTQFKRLTTYSGSGSAPPTIGAFNTIETGNGVILQLPSGMTGGSGAPYSYRIYRGTDANFTASPATLLTTVSSMPYTDTSAQVGTQYFYGVTGVDSSGSTIASVPTGLTVVPSIPNMYIGAQIQKRPLAIVFMGDSITFGTGVTNAGTVNAPTVPYYVMNSLQEQLLRTVTGSNQGVGGKTTTDFLPGTTLYNNAIKNSGSSAANTLLNATPTAQLVVCLALGTNDAASSGTNNGGIGAANGALSPAQYFANTNTIVSQILNVDFPKAMIFLQPTKYFTPNTNNTSVYLQAALSLVVQYNIQLYAVAALYPGRVFVGDPTSFDYFAQQYQAELIADNSGPYGTFYLHPSGTTGSTGRVGTQSLGLFWANEMSYVFGLLGGSHYPASTCLKNVVSGPAFVNIPWLLPSSGIPGSPGFSQPGFTTVVSSGAQGAQDELCNLLDRMVSDGRASVG